MANHQGAPWALRPSYERERAILVGVSFRTSSPSQPWHHGPALSERLEELARLADTAGAEVVGRLTQDRKAISPALFIGKGKGEELAHLCAETGADLVIFAHDLSPAQLRNLEDLTKTRVIDHSEIILDIFAKRAQSRQAKVQVELAQLQYQLPRLKRMWTHLSRIEGGIGLRGPGETQLEVDRRRARRRIGDLQKQLLLFEKRKQVELDGRKGMPSVALVGYTNVGKSSLLNALTASDVFVEDRLFATLDATTRLLRLDKSLEVLLTDTVGFIRDLPHHLVASFHATLEEVRQADLLLHVADAAHPDMEQQIEAVQQVLAEIQCQEKTSLLVLNKSDVADPPMDVEHLSRQGVPSVLVSAKTGAGLERLRTAIAEHFLAERQLFTFRIPHGEGKLQAYLEERGTVLERRYDGEAVEMRVLLHPADAERLSERTGDKVTG